MTPDELKAALLDSLRANDHVAILRYAQKLFFTEKGILNRAAVSEFQAYAPCRIERGSVPECYRIIYNHQTYIFVS